MRWIADECLSRSIVEHLRADGHDVLFVAERHGGISDTLILQMASAEQRLLLTHDSDYGDLLFRDRTLTAPGVVFLRFPTALNHRRWPRLKTVLDDMGEGLFGRFVVITPGRLRWRSLAATG